MFIEWTDRELNSDLRHAKAVSYRWTISPFVPSGPHGSRTHHTDLARVSRPQRHAGPFIERSVRDSNPIFRLTTAACYHNTYRPFLSDPGWNRTSDFLGVIQASLPLDHGIVLVTEVGVEPTKSPRPQRDRFACLRTRSCSSSGSGCRTRQARLMRPR